LQIVSGYPPDEICQTSSGKYADLLGESLDAHRKRRQA
jgi:hypothetical protein